MQTAKPSPTTHLSMFRMPAMPFPLLPWPQAGSAWCWLFVTRDAEPHERALRPAAPQRGATGGRQRRQGGCAPAGLAPRRPGAAAPRARARGVAAPRPSPPPRRRLHPNHQSQLLLRQRGGAAWRLLQLRQSPRGPGPPPPRRAAQSSRWRRRRRRPQRCSRRAPVVRGRGVGQGWGKMLKVHRVGPGSTQGSTGQGQGRCLGARAARLPHRVAARGAKGRAGLTSIRRLMSNFGARSSFTLRTKVFCRVGGWVGGWAGISGRGRPWEYKRAAAHCTVSLKHEGTPRLRLQPAVSGDQPAVPTCSG